LAARREDVVPELTRALAGQSPPEVVRRTEGLLTALRNSTPPDRRRELRGPWTLELVGILVAENVLTELTKGDPEAQLTREAKAARS
jgi:hypothetical protein